MNSLDKNILPAKH